jgi:2-polyprenyl-3-methyl-5-hydroxy-6-metoxy-1,4-benzoquinol methylase
MLGLPGTFPLNQCRHCGIAYLSPRPKDLGPYYGQGYLSHRRARSPLAALRIAVQQRQIAGYVARHTGLSAGRVLDVGCGAGAFLAALKGVGWDVWGVEPGAAAATDTRSRLGPHILHGTLEQVDLPAAAFDLITLWDVIEHLPDPAATLRHIGGLLRPGGVLLIQTPRIDCPDARIWGAAWSGYDPPRHLVVFSGYTLARTLAAAGFASREVPGLASGFQSIVLSARYALAHRFGPPTAARAYRFLASLPVRLLTWPLVAALDRGATPAQLAVVARRAKEYV